jgi:hypothetical protein
LVSNRARPKRPKKPKDHISVFTEIDLIEAMDLRADLCERSRSWLWSFAARKLIELNLDSRKGFAEAAENLEGNKDLESLFCRIAKERSLQAA